MGDRPLLVGTSTKPPNGAPSSPTKRPRSKSEQLANGEAYSIQYADVASGRNIATQNGAEECQLPNLTSMARSSHLVPVERGQTAIHDGRRLENDGFTWRLASQRGPRGTLINQTGTHVGIRLPLPGMKEGPVLAAQGSEPRDRRSALPNARPKSGHPATGSRW